MEHQPKFRNIRLAAEIGPAKTLAVVARFYRRTTEQVLSASRDKTLAECRHITMYLIRKHMDYTFSEIGQMFGDRDHTTVISGINAVTNDLPRNQLLARQLDYIEQDMRGEWIIPPNEAERQKALDALYGCGCA